jgi:peptidoglycan/xylan/chitin deacetylase (PgdA/CDA1 family)
MMQLSVIIQTKGWSERLRANLVSLTQQTLESTDFEVLLVNYSLESLEPRLGQMALPYSTRVIKHPEGSPGTAFIRGVEAARGRFCLFLREDLVGDPGLLAEHLHVQQESGGSLGIGLVRYTPKEGAGWYTNQFCRWQNERISGVTHGERELTWAECTLANLSAPRQAIQAIGNFCTHLEHGYDVELAFRLEQDGLCCTFIPFAAGVCEEFRSFAILMAETRERGAAYVSLWCRQPEMLSGLLGSFYDTSLRGILLRRLLLLLRFPLALLALPALILGENSCSWEWFKFLQSYCFWYGVRSALQDQQTWRRLTHGTPILMYHAFGDTEEVPSRYVMSQRRFAWQMALLKRLGYQVISLEEYLGCLRESRLPPERALVITIDDGYLDNYLLAYPVLRRYGFTATIFLVTNRRKNTWDQDGPLAGRPVMTISQVHELQREGISFGAHTRTHPRLPEISAEQAWEEISGVKIDLEREFGAPVQTFAYPHGKENLAVQTQVEQAGYLGACGVRRGLNSPAAPPFTLYRTEIVGTASLLHFLLSVWSG